MGTTNTMGIPYPESTDAVANGATAMENLATTVDNKTGLVLVKTQVIGNGVSSIPVTDAFSALFDNYKIIVSGGVGNTVQLVGLHMGGTTPASGYFSSRNINTASNGTPSGNGINNSGSWSYAGQASTNCINLNLDLINPFANKFTLYNGSFILDSGAASEFGVTTGLLNNTTSFSGFTLTASNLTGGTIRVYGYRK
jgi:hypothetical protein